MASEGVKIAIAVGHCRSAPGAYSIDGVSEFDFHVPLAGKIAARLADVAEARVFHRPEPNNVAALCLRINEWRPDVAIELHFNGSDGEGHGSEVLYWHLSGRGRDMAIKLQSAFLECLGLRNRGTKSRMRKDRGGQFLESVRCPAIIGEPFFGDHRGDWERCGTPDGRERLIDAYVAGIKSIVGSKA